MTTESQPEPVSDEDRLKAIKNRLRLLADSSNNPDSSEAVRNQLAFHDVLWLLEKMGEGVDLNLDHSERRCDCEYVDVGVGMVRVNEIPECPRHGEWEYPSAMYGREVAPQDTMREAEQFLMSLPESRRNLPEIELVRDLNMHLHNNLIPRPGEHISREYGITVGEGEVCETSSLAGAQYLAEGNEEVKVVGRHTAKIVTAHSRWSEVSYLEQG